MIAKQKKSQVTIFIILGIVMVIIFMVLIFINKYAAKRASTQGTIDAKEITFDVQPIKNFVGNCLDLVSKDGLKKIGKQGGYLFTSQGGTQKDLDNPDKGNYFVEYDNSKVFYNIRKPRSTFTLGSIGKTSLGPPEYPWVRFPYDTKNDPIFRVQGVFGFNDLPPLISMQAQLESFVKNKNNIDKCLDFSVFEEQGFIFDKNEKTVNVDITENDVIFRMVYPIIIGRVNSREKTEIKDFSVTHKVRLKKLHTFLNSLIEADISDIKFNISKGFVDNFDVAVKNNVYGKDDLIIVTDTNKEFFLDGQPYQYSFARKNRNPALHHIENINIARGKNINKEFLINELKLSLGSYDLTYDPDEDTITDDSYSISPDLSDKNFWNSESLIPRPFKVEVVDDAGFDDYQGGIVFTIVSGSP